jgi:hypothetical protein
MNPDRRRQLGELRRNLSPELYDALVRLWRAARRHDRNAYVELVEVRAKDLAAVLYELERCYSTSQAPRKDGET